MFSRNIRVLCVADYYLPGFKGGGPIRTLANMFDILADQVYFSVLTRDRDLGSDVPYDDLPIDEWQIRGNQELYYASPKEFGVRAFNRATSDRPFDLLYLNSFFSFRSSISIYLQNGRFKPKLPVLIAPRGEFSPGAMSLKRKKKRFFLKLSRLAGLYRDVYWHASTPMEEQDILSAFPYAKGKVYLAADPVALPQRQMSAQAVDASDRISIAFISRISPIKNLDGLLTILSKVEKHINLDIYGPIKDTSYWRRCTKIADSLPSHISVKYCGELAPDSVSPTFAKYDLFAFPTHGENFGHVIFESLRAGTPVLLSDQTPWRTDPSGAITVVSLTDIDGWRRQINAAAERSSEQRRKLRNATFEYAVRYASSAENRLHNLNMFLDFTQSNHSKGK